MSPARKPKPQKAEPAVIDAEVAQSSESTSLVIAPKAAIVDAASTAPVYELQIAQKNFEALEQFVTKFLVEGKEGEGDYGTLPGTKKKCLHQSGAHKLCQFFGLAPTFPQERQRRVENWDMKPPLFDYEITCVLVKKGTNFVVAEGLGSCNSWESKYRWRKEERTCPNCGMAAIRQGNETFGDSSSPKIWYCWRKVGGCGQNFNFDDERITEQRVGRVENPDVADSKNTILKIACKRSLVTATITATASSKLFTVDMENAELGGDMEMDGWHPGQEEPSEPAKEKTETKPATKQHKLVGAVADVRSVKSGDRDVLAVKIVWTKMRGKETHAFEQWAAVESGELIGRLKDSLGLTIEVLCSEQAGDKGNYLRVDRVFKDGKGQENLEKDKANLKPGDANRGHGNETQSGASVNGKPADSKPATEGSTPSAPAKTEKREPLPEIKAEPPVIVEVKRKLTEEKRGKPVTTEVTWQNLSGIVLGNTGPQTVAGSKNRRVTIGIAGLDDFRKNPQGRHNRFDCWHESLFDALGCAQPGAKIVFDYFPETLGPRSNHPGTVTQYIEDIIEINGVTYVGGERQGPAVNPAEHGAQVDFK